MSPFDTLTLTMYPFEYIVYRLGHNFRFPAGELYAYSGFRALLELCFLVVPFQESVPEVPNGTPNNLISVGRECPSLRVACCVLQSRYCAPARGGRNARGMRCGIDGQHRGREHTSQNLSMERARLRVRAHKRTFP